MRKQVVLKAGKEKAILNRHHWIFSGAIASLPEFQNGEILEVADNKGSVLGQAYFNKNSSIIGRMLCFTDAPIEQHIFHLIQAAWNFRQTLFHDQDTNAFRVINGEGDFFPGLVVDKYADVLVIQVGTLGVEKLKPVILEALHKIIRPKAVFEKSALPSRKEEGLKPLEQLLFGEVPATITIVENGIHYTVDVIKGQKTGFFLDQREMRKLIGSLAKGKKLLNCFGYTGGFSAYAAKNGALQVDTVDISAEAIALAEYNVQANNQLAKLQFFQEDVFAFLRKQALDYDIVILDPPAFAKRKKDVIQACRGYKDINRVAMEKMPPGSLLLSCSCSHYVDAELFQKVLFQAAVEAKRKVRIIAHHHLAPDHPINICHPEGEYLKSLLLYIE